MSKLSKILIICGPTATGKTSLGIELAKRLDGEIISADSRQVYRNLDIGTGKNIKNYDLRFKNLDQTRYSCYRHDNVNIWGYDLADPEEEFSVGHYSRLMQPVIEDIIARGKLPIIVGGTGFYIKSLLAPPDTIQIKPNQKLRAELEQLSVVDLQERLFRTDSPKLESMNHSDRHNPRRLIRAIEVAESGPAPEASRKSFDEFWIGLTAEKEVLKQLVLENIHKRLDQGFEAEVKSLIDSELDWNLPWASSTGYKIWRQHLEGEIDRETAIDFWQIQEHQYQKRQLTYFKKLEQINWVSVR